jgi:hypothetical protein
MRRGLLSPGHAMGQMIIVRERHVTFERSTRRSEAR